MVNEYTTELDTITHEILTSYQEHDQTQRIGFVEKRWWNSSDSVGASITGMACESQRVSGLKRSYVGDYRDPTSRLVQGSFEHSASFLHSQQQALTRTTTDVKAIHACPELVLHDSTHRCRVEMTVLVQRSHDSWAHAL